MRSETEYIAPIAAEAGPIDGSTTARFLQAVLSVLIVIFGICIVVLVGLAVFTAVPGQFGDDVLAEFQAARGSAMTQKTMATACLTAAALMAAYTVVIILLRKITKTLRDGDPFVPVNLSRLRWIWVIIAGAEITRFLMKMIMSLGSDTIVFDVRIGTWFLVFVIAALAEVFRHGTELRRDAELTV